MMEVEQKKSPQRIRDPRSMSFEELYQLEITTVAIRPSRGNVGYFSIGPATYYLKKYKSPGKKIFRYLFKSKARKEYENQVFFQKMGIDTPEIVVFQESGVFRRRAILVTREVPRTSTLVDILSASPPSRSPEEIDSLLKKLAVIVRRLHAHGFVHNDFRMRNVLVQEDRLFLFDCPNGMILHYVPFFFSHRKVKDLALLFEDGKRFCSAPQMLRFFLRYAEAKRLDERHKKVIRKVVRYYS